MKCRTLLAATFVALWVPFGVAAQESQAGQEDPAHDELRAVRDSMIEAVNKQDLDRLLSHLHPNVVVTWLNGEVSRGPEEVRAYYNRMMTGPNRIVATIRVNPVVDRLSDLYGDTAVAYGSSSDHFELTAGMKFDVKSRWSATVVKQDGRWLVVNFHASTNMFDNELLNMTKRTMYWVGGIAAVVGVGLGVVIILVLQRLRRRSS